jgi:hypothetical protein
MESQRANKSVLAAGLAGLAKFRRVLALPALLLSSLGGCSAWKGISDQSRFASLDEIAHDGKAFVRLYAAPVPSVEHLAVHAWFVVKAAESESFERWEVWQDAGVKLTNPSVVSYGHVYRNLQGPTADVGAGGTYILAEQIGPEADSVVRFIQSQSPSYPLRSRYSYYPGPNSNTYIQWVLNCSGWAVRLPAAAIGKNWLRGRKELRSAESQAAP